MRFLRLLPLLLASASLRSATDAGAAPGPRVAAATRTPDSTVTAAADALARGLPWRASRILAPVLRDSTRRSPSAILLAAEAATAWSGWREVTDLLDGQPWVDSSFDGRGRALLARAALEQGRDTLALAHATAAVAAVKDGAARADAQVLLARALDRIGGDSAAAAVYARAAAAEPAIAQWLILRSASASHDSAGRARLYAQLTLPAARARIPWAEAAATQRAGDTLGAARHLAALGAMPASLALRAAAAHDSAASVQVRDELLIFIGQRSGTGAAKQAVETLDLYFPTLTPAAQLVVARSAAASGPLPRAAAAFAAAFEAGLGEPQDRVDYGGVLTRLGRYKDAVAQFARVDQPRPVAATAAYGRARALVRDGQIDLGRTALLRVGQHFPRDTTPAASALYLLADLAVDDRDDAEARQRFRDLAKRFPTSRYAPTARFRAALIAYAAGHARQAATELDSLVVRYPKSDEAIAARYWSGRAWSSAGDSIKARSRWQQVVSGDPLSYYVGVSERRLGLGTWTPPASRDSFARFPDIDSALARATALERLGLDTEAGWEYDAIAGNADSSAERLLAAANALRSRGLAVPSIQLARRALAKGAAPDARVYRLIYPLTRQEALLAESAERKLDPTFVAALIRQESMFNPRATSAVGARGLMQLMPDVGRVVSSRLGFPIWDPVLLYQPDVNLQLGAAHLRELSDRYASPVQILAAYNAGSSRVDRWRARTGTDDPELFAERIPFPETRDYVRIIQRNQAIYRALYDWSGGSPDSPRPLPGGS